MFQFFKCSLATPKRLALYYRKFFKENTFIIVKLKSNIRIILKYMPRRLLLISNSL